MSHVTNSVENRRVLLVHMPIAIPTLPNLAIERLAKVLTADEFEVDTLYGTLQFYPPLPMWLSCSSIAPAFFGPTYYDEDDESWLQHITAHLCTTATIESLPAKYDQVLKDGMQASTRCIQSCLEHAISGNYSVVGFSIGFDAQRLPSAALAKVLKRHRPDIKIIAGGTACDGEMGPALLDRFPCFDAVLAGESEATISSAIGALLRSNVDPIPGFLARGAEPANSEFVFSDSLARLDCPDYSDFFGQVAGSGFEADIAIQKTVFYEGSRGCWYGLKNHCTFCGIRAVDFPYRTVPHEEFLMHVLELQSTWSPDLIYLTDAILSREAFTMLLPVLARERAAGTLKSRFFAETKSNLTPHEVRQLSLANIRTIQPGIESFLTTSLNKMKKGATGIQQIELLKWCKAFGITPMYGILLGTPGETDEDQYDLADICSLLHHLPPPTGTNLLGLHRFSPYFRDPEKFGIEKIFPFEYQRTLYKCSDEMLMRLCYEFNHELAYASGAATADSEHAVTAEVVRWQKNFGSKHLIHFDYGQTAVIVREIAGEVAIEKFSGAGVLVLRHCHRAISAGKLKNLCRNYSASEIDDAILELVNKEILLELDNRILNLAAPSEPHKLLAGEFGVEHSSDQFRIHALT